MVIQFWCLVIYSNITTFVLESSACSIFPGNSNQRKHFIFKNSNNAWITTMFLKMHHFTNSVSYFLNTPLHKTNGSIIPNFSHHVCNSIGKLIIGRGVSNKSFTCLPKWLHIFFCFVTSINPSAWFFNFDKWSIFFAHFHN